MLMEIVPRSPLAPNTEYELSWKMSARAERVFPAPWHGERLSVGKFTTGSTRDSTAPSMPPSLPSVLVDTIGLRETIAMIEKSGVPVPSILAKAAPDTHFFNHPTINIGKFFVAG